MLRFLLAVVISFALCVGAVAQTGRPEMPKAQSALTVPCSDCHVCEKPTSVNPCLNRCPREGSEVTSNHVPEEGPKVIIINELEDQYVPVVFAHRLHAQMGGMREGCAECHHYTPTGEISACKECHGKGVNPQNLRQPGLRGAYHRQCMNCHREWSHDTKCSVCHARKSTEGTATASLDTTDIMGSRHPQITEPDKKIYQTSMKDGPVVTFHHRQHIHMFGLKCVDCHRQENCSRCHTPPDQQTATKTLREHHAPCFSCHEKDPCNWCHQQKETPAFAHAQTGWSLNPFHQSLSCNACHSTGQRISRLDPTCTSCHEQWNPSSFDHAQITGVILDDTHRALDCSDCHVNKRFDQNPSCAACHDDGRSYPQSKPGT